MTTDFILYIPSVLSCIFFQLSAYNYDKKNYHNVILYFGLGITAATLNIGI